MRKLLIALLIFVTGTAIAQPTNYTRVAGRYRWTSGYFDSTLHLPSGTTPKLGGGFAGPGALFYKTTDSLVYLWTGYQWKGLSVSPNTLYNANDSLTSNRTVSTSSGKTLTFQPATTFTKNINVNNVSVGAGNYQDVSNTNVAVGFGSMTSNTGGAFNTSIGMNAQTSLLTGSRNTALGTLSLNTATASSENVAVGDEAGRYVTGSQNTILGSQAWKGSAGNSTGTRNIAVGWGALPNTTSGSNNIAMGPAMGSNTTGSLNVAIGGESLAQNTTAGGNVAVGYAALTASTGTNNIAIGTIAGKSITSGSNNTLVGSGGNSMPGVTTGSNNTIIGSQISGLAGTLANHIILADGQGNMRLAIDGSGNGVFGGGSSLPTFAGYKFDVLGTGRFTNHLTLPTGRIYMGDGTTGINIFDSTHYPTTRYIQIGNITTKPNLSNYMIGYTGGLYTSANMRGNSNIHIGAFTTDTTATNTITIINSAGAGQPIKSNSIVLSPNYYQASLQVQNSIMMTLGGYGSTYIGQGFLGKTVLNNSISFNASAFDNSFTAGAASAEMSNVAFGQGLYERYFSLNGASYTIHGTSPIGVTDNPGANIGLAGGRATGNGYGGDILFSTAIQGSTGTTIQTLSERMRVMGQNGYVRTLTGMGFGRITDIGVPTITGFTTGGTLTDGLYIYNIVAVDALGGLTTFAGGESGVNLTGTGGNGSVTITWPAATGAVSYRVYKKTYYNGIFAGYFTTTNTSFTDVGGSITANNGYPYQNNTVRYYINSSGGGKLGQMYFDTDIYASGTVKVGYGGGAQIFNTAVGSSTLNSNTTGNFNVAIGSSALQNNTIGAVNTAVGVSSLQSSTTGYANVGVGSGALANMTSGSNNIAIGDNAGKFITGGVTSTTTAGNSIFIGRNTKSYADNNTNQIVIGNDAVGLGNNTTVIGNASTTDAAIYGRTLINYSSPTASTYALDVNGTGRFKNILNLDSNLVFSNANGSQKEIKFASQGIQINHNYNAVGNDIVIGWSGATLSGNTQRGAYIGFNNSGNKRDGMYVVGSGNNFTGYTGNAPFIFGRDLQLDATSEGLGYAIGSSGLVRGAFSGIGATDFGNAELPPVGLSQGPTIIGVGVNNQSISAQSIYLGQYGSDDGMPSAARNVFVSTTNGVGTDVEGYNLVFSSGRSTGSATSKDIIFATPTPGSTGTALQTLTQRWWVKGNSGALSNVSTPDASAVLQVNSTTKGVLVPRMTTTEILAISSPATGLIVFNITLAELCFYDGTAWRKFSHSTM